MKPARNAFLLAVAFIAQPYHLGHGEGLMIQDAPVPFLRLLSRYEHLVMRGINYLATRHWIYEHDFTKRIVDRISRGVTSIANGEVLTLDEVREMLDNIFNAGYAVAVGTCPCRRARREMSDVVPNDTDMVFGVWAEQYLRNYPDVYRTVSPDEARELVEDFDRHGLIHQVYGYFYREGAAYVLCNCAPEVCIPLLAQKTRGYESFRRGRSRASVEREACLGTEQCGACLERCPFDARRVRDGVVEVDHDRCFGCGLCVSTCRGGVTSLSRVPGAELVYTRRLVT